MTQLGFHAAAAIVLAASASLAAADRGAPASTLSQRLARPVGVEWRAAGSRDAIVRLGATHGVAVFFDRRLDPHREIALRSSNEPVGAVLVRAAAAIDAGAVAVGEGVYVGPADDATRLPALLARSAASREATATASVRRALRKTGVTRWDRLAEPRQVVGEALANARLGLANPERVPHDLWPAGETPRASLADRLTLLLYGFGLTWEIDTRAPRRLRVAAIDRDSLPSTALPPLTVATGEPPLRESRYTLRVREQPLAAVLRTLAQRTGRAFRPSERLAAQLERRISFSVTEATLDELLAAAAAAGGLSAYATPAEIVVEER